MNAPRRWLARVLLTASLLGGGCSTLRTQIYELPNQPDEPPRPPERARPPESVAVYKNSLPRRYFRVTHVIEVDERPYVDEHLLRLRAHAARLGCDAVAVFNRQHPVIAAGAKSPEDVFVLDLDLDRRLASRSDVGGSPGSIWVHKASHLYEMSGGSFGLCTFFYDSTSAEKPSPPPR